MRWSRSVRFKLFGRWRKNSFQEEEPKEGRKCLSFASLLRRKKGRSANEQFQLTESEEDLKNWKRRREVRSPCLSETIQSTTSCDESVTVQAQQNVIVESQSSRQQLHERTSIRSGSSQHQETTECNGVWRTRLLKQEDDIQNLNNVIESLKVKVGKKDAECSELKKEIEKYENGRKGGKGRNSLIADDKCFQTVIFPGQFSRPMYLRRQTDSESTGYGSLNKKDTGTQTEPVQVMVNYCQNEDCRRQLLELKRESNSLKVQLVEDEDIILGLELDHDALRKYLTQTEIKLQKSQEELELVKRNLGDQEKHFRRLIAGYEDRMSSLKVQNDKLSKKVLGFMNKSTRQASNGPIKSIKNEVGTQVTVQASGSEASLPSSDAYQSEPANRFRRSRQGGPSANAAMKFDRPRNNARRATEISHKNMKGNVYYSREVRNRSRLGHDIYPSSDTSLEMDHRKRAKATVHESILEREDSGLETDRSYVSHDLELKDRKHLQTADQNEIIGAQCRKIEEAFRQKMGMSSRQPDDYRVCDKEEELDKLAKWRHDVLSQLLHSPGEKSGDAKEGKLRKVERRRTVNEGKTLGAKVNHAPFRQSWHEAYMFPDDAKADQVLCYQVRGTPLAPCVLDMAAKDDCYDNFY